MAKISDQELSIEGALSRNVRTVAANAALTLGPKDSLIVLANSSDANAKAATIGALVPGQEISLYLAARSSTGTYTVALASGTLTLDAAREGATVRFNGTALVPVGLAGATVV